MPRLIRAAAPARAVSEFVAEFTPLSCRRPRASIVLGSSCDINSGVGSNGIDGNIQRRQPSEYDRSLGSAHPNSCLHAAERIIIADATIFGGVYASKTV